jgi:hypothetical protein
MQCPIADRSLNCYGGIARAYQRMRPTRSGTASGKTPSGLCVAKSFARDAV